MIRSLRGFPLLDGARGRPKADVAALARALSALSAFAAAAGPRLAGGGREPAAGAAGRPGLLRRRCGDRAGREPLMAIDYDNLLSYPIPEVTPDPALAGCGAVQFLHRPRPGPDGRAAARLPLRAAAEGHAVDAGGAGLARLLVAQRGYRHRLAADPARRAGADPAQAAADRGHRHRPQPHHRHRRPRRGQGRADVFRTRGRRRRDRREAGDLHQDQLPARQWRLRRPDRPGEAAASGARPGRPTSRWTWRRGRSRRWSTG